jgi:hypothetical protein
MLSMPGLATKERLTRRGKADQTSNVSIAGVLAALLRGLKLAEAAHL